CLWDGGSCGILLDDTSAAGVNRHLKEFHFCNQEKPWDNRSRGICHWEVNCGREMYYESFGKHVAAVHLRCTVRECEQCHREFARPDTLRRHVASTCSGQSEKTNRA
ncbi:hypothetical protein WOLCODRAFT_78117, partial [Wolfiporia cocos MD-104 SS10]